MRFEIGSEVLCRVLLCCGVSPGPEAVATSFHQGRRNLAKVQTVLAVLARMGFVSTADGGKTFGIRRVGVMILGRDMALKVSQGPRRPFRRSGTEGHPKVYCGSVGFAGRQ